MTTGMFAEPNSNHEIKPPTNRNLTLISKPWNIAFVKSADALSLVRNLFSRHNFMGSEYGSFFLSNDRHLEIDTKDDMVPHQPQKDKAIGEVPLSALPHTPAPLQITPCSFKSCEIASKLVNIRSESVTISQPGGPKYGIHRPRR